MGECRLGVHGAGLDRTRRRWGNFLRLKETRKIRVLCYPDRRLPPIYHTLERPICEPPLACPACFKARELTSSFAQQSRMKRGSGRPHMPLIWLLSMRAAGGASGCEHDLADVLALQDPAVGCRCFGEGVRRVDARLDLVVLP